MGFYENIQMTRYPDQSAHAVVEVGADEIADEERLRLLDGETGHFGIRVSLVTVDKAPDIIEDQWNRRDAKPNNSSAF
jgi:hypothetical protein